MYSFTLRRGRKIQRCERLLSYIEKLEVLQLGVTVFGAGGAEDARDPVRLPVCVGSLRFPIAAAAAAASVAGYWCCSCFCSIVQKVRRICTWVSAAIVRQTGEGVG